MGRLDDKVAIITGAASGMGLGTAQLFAKEGAKVVATDIAVEPLEKAVEEIKVSGGDVLAVELNVANQESWNAAVEKAIAEYGKIDILVNNAGIHSQNGILEAEMDDWNKVIEINLTGVWLGMKYVIPHMKENGGGSIINTSSVAALIGGLSDGGGAAYSATKGAVRSLTKHAAQWFGEFDIRANSIHPGTIFTEISKQYGYETPEEGGAGMKDKVALKPYMGDVSDIANANLYLASDESKFVTGLEMVVDGGWTSGGL